MAKQSVMNLYRDTDTGDLLIEMKSHSIDTVWVGGVLYSILAKYMDCIPDSAQIEFLKESMDMFNALMKDQKGAVYIHPED
jgi:hypothetical protein